jgi:hypothetical protein
VAVGRKGAHQRGWLTVVNVVACECSMAVQTNGHQRRSSGHRGTGCLGEACEVPSSVRGQREPVVDGSQLVEEEAVRDGALPSDVAGGLSYNQVPEAMGDAADFLAGSGGDGRAWH